MGKSQSTNTSANPITGCLAALSAAVLIALLSTPPALADTGGDDPLAAISVATPDTVNNAARVATRAVGENAIEATVADVEIAVPVHPSDSITVGAGSESIGIGLPFATSADDAAVEERGIVSYDNKNGSTSVPVVTRDGTLQINTVITTPSAPTRYDYDLMIPEDGQIVGSDAGYFIVNVDGDALAHIPAPWAKDATGAEVPTHYELNGSTLTQVVEFTSTTAFPVVADPQFAWYGLMPSVKLTRAETKTATTATGMATVCGWVARFTSFAGGALCGLNAGSIILNSQRIYYTEKKCSQLLIGPGVIGTIPYSGGYCK